MRVLTDLSTVVCPLAVVRWYGVSTLIMFFFWRAVTSFIDMMSNALPVSINQRLGRGP